MAGLSSSARSSRVGKLRYMGYSGQADPAFWRPGEPGVGDRSGPRAATVCMRGHVLKRYLAEVPAEPLGFCLECGAPVIGRCPSCKIRVRGSSHVPGYLGIDHYEPPRFCDGCGEPLPWATWQDRIYQLENLVQYEQIDEATKLLVLEDLRRLRTAASELDQDGQLTIWKRVKSRAPGLFGGAATPIAQNLLSAYLQQKLGI